MAVTPALSIVTTSGRKWWLKIDIKSRCWRLNAVRRILKSGFFSPMLDTNFMNVGQIAHK